MHLKTAAQMKDGSCLTSFYTPNLPHIPTAQMEVGSSQPTTHLEENALWAFIGQSREVKHCWMV